MKIAVVTSIIGGIDRFNDFPKQTIDHDFYFYDHEKIFPFVKEYTFKPLYRDRMISKFPKMRTHILLPGYDLYIWIDGSYKILSESFISYLLLCLGKNDIWFKKHSLCDCLYHEGNFLIQNISDPEKDFHAYFKKRFHIEDIQAEIDFYKKQNFPEKAGMYQGGLFIRRNNFHTNIFFDLWFSRCLLYSPKDQMALAYLLNVLKPNFSDRDIRYREKLVDHLPHLY